MKLLVGSNNVIQSYAIIGGFLESDGYKVVDVSNDMEVQLENFEVGKYLYISGKIEKSQTFEEQIKNWDLNLKSQKRIAQLKEQLEASDYTVIKIAEGVATHSEYEEILAKRKNWREEINQLEQLLTIAMEK